MYSNNDQNCLITTIEGEDQIVYFTDETFFKEVDFNYYDTHIKNQFTSNSSLKTETQNFDYYDIEELNKGYNEELNKGYNEEISETFKFHVTIQYQNY